MSDLKRQSSAPGDDQPAPKRQAKEDGDNLSGGEEKQAGPAAPSPVQGGGASSTDAASTSSPSTSGGGTCSGSGSGGTCSGSEANILDLCPLRPGDRIEVKWDLHVDVPVDAGKNATGATGTDDSSNSSHKTPVKQQTVQTKTITMWWGAFLLPPDGRTHVLTDDGGDFGASPVPTPKKPADAATVPIRTLDYDAMPHYGFPDRSLEDVVFLSDHTLLNMSSGTRAHYRKEGANWEPSDSEQIGEDGLCRADYGQADTPAAASASASTSTLASAPDASGAPAASASPCVTVDGEEGIRTVLDSVLLKAMSGVSDQLGRLNPAQQRVVAAKIADAKEKLVTKMVEARDGSNGSGGTVITPAYVKQCMEEVGKEL